MAEHSINITFIDIQQKVLDVQGQDKAHTELVQSSELRMQTLRTDFESKRAEVGELMRQIEGMNEKHEMRVKELELEVVAVSHGLQDSDARKEEFEKQLFESRELHTQAETKLEENTLLLEAAQSEAAQFSVQVANRTSEYDELVVEMQQLKQTLNAMASDNSNSSEMESKYNTLTSKMKKLQDQLKRRSVELHGDISTVQTQLLTTKTALSRVKNEKEKLSVECSEHQTTLQELRLDNSTKADELKKTSVQLIELTENYEESQATVTELTAKLSSTEAKLEDQTSAKATTDAEVQNLRDLLQKSETQSSVLESTIYKLRKEIDDQTKEVDQLKSSDKLVGGMHEQVEGLESKLDVATKENQGLKDEVASLQQAVKETESRCEQFAQLGLRVKDINNKLDQYKTLYETATKKISDLTAENSSLKEDLSTATNESATVSRLEEQVVTLTQDIHNKENKCASLQDILDARQCEWASKDNSHESAKRQAEKRERELNEANSQLCVELSDLNNELSNVRDQLSKRSSAAISTEQGLRTKVVDLENRVSTMSNELELAKTKASEPTQADAKEALIEELKSAINEQEKTQKLQDEVVKTKEEEVHMLTKEIFDWRLKCQEYSDVELEKNSLASKLTSVTNEKNFLQEVQAKMMTQVSTLNQNSTKLQAEIANLTTEKTTLQAKIDAVNDEELENKEKEMEHLKETMEQWQTDKQALVVQLESVLQKKDETINKLKANSDDDMLKKDKIILQLENKIRSQEYTLQNLVVGSGRTTRTRSIISINSEEKHRIQSLEASFKQEQSLHSEAQKALDRVLVAKDEQMADMKTANHKLQIEIQRLNSLLTSQAPRRSDRFKEPNFSNDSELSASTLQLDVTPMSSVKKSATKSSRKSTRKSSSTQKENSSKATTLKRSLRDMVERSTSPLASPAKKLLQVKVTPLKEIEAVSAASNFAEPERTSVRSTKRRRKLYTVDEGILTSPAGEESPSEAQERKKKASINSHSHLLRNLRSSQLK